MEALFKAYAALGNRAVKHKKETASEIVRKLSAHAEMEEVYAEHEVVKGLMEEYMVTWCKRRTVRRQSEGADGKYHSPRQREEVELLGRAKKNCPKLTGPSSASICENGKMTWGNEIANLWDTEVS